MSDKINLEAYQAYYNTNEGSAQNPAQGLPADGSAPFNKAAGNKND